MQGASREALAGLREDLPRPGAGASLGLARELLSVVGLLHREAPLRTALSDPGNPAEARDALAAALLGGRLSGPALDVVRSAVRRRWSTPRDLVDALEIAAASTAFGEAEHEGRLDRVEDELFRFGRTLAAEPALRTALDDAALPVERKRALVHDLVAARADPTTVALLEHAVDSPRGRRVAEVIDVLTEIAAERRSELLAEVRTAVPLTAEQDSRLRAALGRLYGRPVRLQEVTDPGVIGGVVVQVGDEVIDGSLASRLAQARRQLVD